MCPASQEENSICCRRLSLELSRRTSAEPAGRLGSPLQPQAGSVPSTASLTAWDHTARARLKEQLCPQKSGTLTLLSIPQPPSLRGLGMPGPAWHQQKELGAEVCTPRGRRHHTSREGRPSNGLTSPRPESLLHHTRSSWASGQVTLDAEQPCRVTHRMLAEYACQFVLSEPRGS